MGMLDWMESAMNPKRPRSGGGGGGGLVVVVEMVVGVCWTRSGWVGVKAVFVCSECAWST